MKIIPIASDSLGVRSMATYVETNDCKILIDPSAALGPKRYGLPPHDKEHKVFNETKKKISEIAQKCDILTISHYHFDHYDSEEEFFKEKKVFLKEISKDINKSQSQRGADFKNKVEKNCDLIFCDNSKHRIGDTEIIFSPPFFHGPENIRLGYVIMTTVDDGEKRILHASDVQGPVSKNATKYIIDQKPDLLIIDGPPTNMLGFRFSKKNLQKASENLVKIIEKLKCEIILDHHIIRDLKYKQAFPTPYSKGGVKLKTFAEYLGKENNTLEANRKNLWGK
jgi:predicted metallo-beta-lactamase superfamily hydrolase